MHPTDPCHHPHNSLPMLQCGTLRAVSGSPLLVKSLGGEQNGAQGEILQGL